MVPFAARMLYYISATKTRSRGEVDEAPCNLKTLSSRGRMANPRRSKSNKSASIYDVAQAARVSVFTVSAVVNKKSHVGKKLRERVEAAIHELHYRPNLQIGRAP